MNEIFHGDSVLRPEVDRIASDCCKDAPYIGGGIVCTTCRKAYFMAWHTSIVQIVQIPEGRMNTVLSRMVKNPPCLKCNRYFDNPFGAHAECLDCEGQYKYLAEYCDCGECAACRERKEVAKSIRDAGLR